MIEAVEQDPSVIQAENEVHEIVPEPDLEASEQEATAMLRDPKFVDFMAELDRVSPDAETIKNLAQAHKQMKEATSGIMQIYKQEVFQGFAIKDQGIRSHFEEEVRTSIEAFITQQIKESIDYNGQLPEGNPLANVVAQIEQYKVTQAKVKSKKETISAQIEKYRESTKKQIEELKAQRAGAEQAKQEAEREKGAASEEYQAACEDLARLDGKIRGAQKDNFRTFKKIWRKEYRNKGQGQLEDEDFRLERRMVDTEQRAVYQTRKIGLQDDIIRDIDAQIAELEASTAKSEAVIAQKGEDLHHKLEGAKADLVLTLGPLADAKAAYSRAIEEESQRLLELGRSGGTEGYRALVEMRDRGENVEEMYKNCQVPNSLDTFVKTFLLISTFNLS